MLRAVEICAGAGGQAIGFHEAGFEHVALVELDANACATLRHNGARWGWADRVHRADVRTWSLPADFGPVDILCGGVPCTPFSVSGNRRGRDDERDLFPALLRLAGELKPRAVQVENVRGLLSSKFAEYRAFIEAQLVELGYVVRWQLLNAADFGVPQRRLRVVLVALRPDDMAHFSWPDPLPSPPPTVGEVLSDSMASRGWEGAASWAAGACEVAPTVCAGRANTPTKMAWARLGVDLRWVADDVPGVGFVGMPRLTVRQLALVQGFPAWWEFQGGKTSAYCQVGNAFPPPVARAVGERIVAAFKAGA